MPRACAAQQEKPLQWKARAQLKMSPNSSQLQKSPRSNKDPTQPKISKIWERKNVHLSKNPPCLLESDIPHQPCILTILGVSDIFLQCWLIIFASGIANPRIKWHSLNTARRGGNPTRGALKQSKQTTSKPHQAIWTCYRTDGTLNCLIPSAEQRKEMF